MPEIAKFYIRHTVIGFVWAAVFTGLLMWFNVANLWHLVTHSDVGFLATFLLWFFNGIVFSGVQNGIAIFTQAAPEDDGDGGGAADALAVPITLRR